MEIGTGWDVGHVQRMSGVWVGLGRLCREHREVEDWECGGGDDGSAKMENSGKVQIE